jgi:succinylglutamic semialdehyde dehydrogenase
VALGHEELFGPLLTLEPFDDLDEAISRSNRSRYGLAAAVFTASKDTFERCADGLDVGLCNWNRASVGSSSKLPFGGRKQSGNHRPAGLFSAYACVDAVAQLHVPTPPAQVTLSPGLKVR